MQSLAQSLHRLAAWYARTAERRELLFWVALPLLTDLERPSLVEEAGLEDNFDVLLDLHLDRLRLADGDIGWLSRATGVRIAALKPAGQRVTPWL